MTIIAIVAGIAIPGLLRARISGNEAAAINALRTIHSAQAAFRHICGHETDYAASLPQLGSAMTLSPDLAWGVAIEKSGYRITLSTLAAGRAPDTCTRQATAAGWYAEAVPISVGASGRRGFATTEREGIWQDASGAAPRNPFVASKTVSPLN